MIRSVGLVLMVALVGCDDKKKKCEELVEHMESVARKEGRPDSQTADDHQMCKDDLSDKEIDCMMKAETTMAIIQCAKP